MKWQVISSLYRVRFASLATIILQNSFHLLINSHILKFVINKTFTLFVRVVNFCYIFYDFRRIVTQWFAFFGVIKFYLRLFRAIVERLAVCKAHCECHTIEALLAEAVDNGGGAIAIAHTDDLEVVVVLSLGGWFFYAVSFFFVLQKSGERLFFYHFPISI